ncbi:DUF6427 family protein [Winogradskyella alexanderae]|uniref:DUF6427 family protein n=1 Tax=Winogradskyella alexanderae TaxID=2877123 RepID=A0ABS7XNF7_9FLAO|nr:DUF6427 family protein [Winogradskyella alexanderae]MCA0131310.1 DUF6427 family protein [Winogradskyella alexanderae]
MITSVFNKSKPVNFLIVLTFVLLIIAISNYNSLFNGFDNTLIVLFKILVIVFKIFLFDFIVGKNNLTKRNSFAILAFGILISFFPTIFNNIDLLLSNLFIILALRRIISLGSKKNIKKKLFDASFWIAMATLFYFWAILFFAIIIVGLIYYSQNDIKNVIIPLIGVITVLILLVAYNILIQDKFFGSSNFEITASLDFTPYNKKATVFKLTILITSFLWTIVYYFKSIADKNNKLKPSYFLIAWTSIISILIALIAPVKNGSEFIFLFAPLSIILANYIEVISERWFKEIFVGILLLTPVLGLFL